MDGDWSKTFAYNCQHIAWVAAKRMDNAQMHK